MHSRPLASAAAAFAVLLVANASSLAQSIATSGGDGFQTVTVDGRNVLQYFVAPHPYKLYASQLFTPAGIQILRDSPHDHVHHHALMYAIGIDGVDCWSESPDQKPGKQIPIGGVTNSNSLVDGQGFASVAQTIRWTSADDETLAEEDRTVTYHVGFGKDVSLLTWRFRMRPPAGKERAELWGRHYFGLGMRFVESMDEGGRFFSPAKEAATVVRGSESLVRAPWCAFTAKVDGKSVTVAMFDDPRNPRHPATWFTMNSPFAYLSATLDLAEEKLTITHQKPLSAAYGVAVWDGEVADDKVQQAYDRWVRLE